MTTYTTRPQGTYQTGRNDAALGHKPFPPAPWRYTTPEQAAAATRDYMRGYDAAVSELKVGML